ncbi:hypothetical protein J2Y40_001244 [Chryseobacterium sp. 2987]|nr:hypothetical protein [Chryseobacterium sp. 2987]
MNFEEYDNILKLFSFYYYHAEYQKRYVAVTT